jgi:hypothetical protein
MCLPQVAAESGGYQPPAGVCNNGICISPNQCSVSRFNSKRLFEKINIMFISVLQDGLEVIVTLQYVVLVVSMVVAVLARTYVCVTLLYGSAPIVKHVCIY